MDVINRRLLMAMKGTWGCNPSRTEQSRVEHRIVPWKKHPSHPTAAAVSQRLHGVPPNPRIAASAGSPHPCSDPTVTARFGLPCHRVLLVTPWVSHSITRAAGVQAPRASQCINKRAIVYERFVALRVIVPAGAAARPRHSAQRAAHHGECTSEHQQRRRVAQSPQLALQPAALLVALRSVPPLALEAAVWAGETVVAHRELTVAARHRRLHPARPQRGAARAQSCIAARQSIAITSTATPTPAAGRRRGVRAVALGPAHTTPERQSREEEENKRWERAYKSPWQQRKQHAHRVAREEYRRAAHARWLGRHPRGGRPTARPIPL
jgi:hypothetical protein